MTFGNRFKSRTGALFSWKEPLRIWCSEARTYLFLLVFQLCTTLRKCPMTQLTITTILLNRLFRFFHSPNKRHKVQNHTTISSKTDRCRRSCSASTLTHLDKCSLFYSIEEHQYPIYRADQSQQIRGKTLKLAKYIEGNVIICGIYKDMCKMFKRNIHISVS